MDLPAIDVVEIFDLKASDPCMPIRVASAPAQTIASLWRALLPESKAAPGEPREPQWTLRFISGGESVEEASVCWRTGVIRRAGHPSVPLSFDRASEPSRQLLATLRDQRVRERLIDEARTATEHALAALADHPERWRRSAPCPRCRTDSTQLLHGVDARGQLWKGHLCACRGWQCSDCSMIVDRQSSCCK